MINYVSILPRLATGIIFKNLFYCVIGVSILPRLATGIITAVRSILPSCFYSSPSCDGDLIRWLLPTRTLSFYSSPSCDGDHDSIITVLLIWVSILPRLATGIDIDVWQPVHWVVSILPRLATGIERLWSIERVRKFLFFPVLRRGSLRRFG